MTLFKSIVFVLVLSLITSCNFIESRQAKKKLSPALLEKIMHLYQECDLEGTIPFEIFKQAMHGYFNIKLKNNRYITIIDYSLPSSQKRLYVIDLQDKGLKYHTWVAHGKNSGENQAATFSNRNGSKQSSLGFFKTSETYQGKHGYSLRLDGLEKGINDQARKRLIVIHGADYVSEDFIQKNGRLGRSWGCLALPQDLTTEIIDLIKEGSCLYIYAEDEDYFEETLYN